MLWKILLLFIFFISIIQSHSLVLFITKILFVGLIEVDGRNDSSWNLNNLIWSEASLKTLQLGLAQIALLFNRALLES